MDRLAPAFEATRDSLGFGPITSTSTPDGLGRRLTGRNAFGSTTADLVPDSGRTRVHLQMTYPLPFEMRTPMLHLRWGYLAVKHLSPTTAVANVPERIWPATRATCDGLGQADFSALPGVVPPAAVRSVAPDYPNAASDSGLEGRVHMRLAIDTRGDVTCAEVMSGLSPTLNQSALTAARQWRFRPATVGGQPLAVLVTLPIAFRVPVSRLPPPNTSGTVPCSANPNDTSCQQRPTSATGEN